MGRRKIYHITKEDSEDITDFKEWAVNLLIKNKKEVASKETEKLESFDYDGIADMFDFSRSMQQMNVKEKVIQEHTFLSASKVSKKETDYTRHTTNAVYIPHEWNDLEEEVEKEHDDLER